jgi:phenylpyruvate tautomerase PptA (4-oxalocrotonate tautomerase family)
MHIFMQNGQHTYVQDVRFYINLENDMPTYIVSASSDILSERNKRTIAEKITQGYADITGGPTYLAQVIFTAIPSGSHYIGGKPLSFEHVFVHGYTRQGKTPQIKASMLDSMVNIIAQTLSINRRSVWAYLSELPHTELVEYGHVAPGPGRDGEWLDTLPIDDAEFIRNV